MSVLRELLNMGIGKPHPISAAAICDEVDAIWRAIEALKEKQDIIENGPKVSVLCRKCKAENMVYDYAQWEYTCRKCGFDHAEQYKDDEPDYRALYEKEKEKWEKLKEFLTKNHEELGVEIRKMIVAKATFGERFPLLSEGLAISNVLEKMQQLEAK